MTAEATEARKEGSGLDRLRAALDFVEGALECEVVFYNGPINEDGYGKFVEATLGIKPDRRLLLCLSTYGGSADSAYRIARFSQNFFRDFQLFVPSLCKSAGTLLALGASKIHMTPFGELGPLDVQVFKADEIFERRSGLLSKSAVWSLTEEAFRMFETVLLGIKGRSNGTVGFRVSSQVAATITQGLLAPVMSQLDPLAIGEDYQNLHIAHEYGERLIRKYDAIDDDAVRALVEDYPSHGFAIDLMEASELLGNVELATAEMMQLQAGLAGRLHRPNFRDVEVGRLRTMIGEADAQNPDETAAPNGDAGHPVERADQPSGDDDRGLPASSRSRPGRGNGAAQGAKIR